MRRWKKAKSQAEEDAKLIEEMSESLDRNSEHSKKSSMMVVVNAAQGMWHLMERRMMDARVEKENQRRAKTWCENVKPQGDWRKPEVGVSMKRRRRRLERA